MKAVLLYEYGGPDKLRYEDTDVPKYGDNEVLVRVKATSINPVDYKIRSGAAKARMPVEFPAILGRDLAGEVVEAGRSVTGFPKGMRVMALANGTYAEYTVAKADVLAPIPDPQKVICVGLNYADHARESGVNPPEEPVFFNKFPTAVAAHGDTIMLPAVSKEVDYEAELADDLRGIVAVQEQF